MARGYIANIVRDKMMGRNVLNQSLKRVIEVTAAKLARLGFTRDGAILRVLGHGNSGVIEIQRSTENTRNKLLFTVNLAVACGALLDPHEPALEKARSVNAHLRQRIGMLLPGRPDRWWEITDLTDADALANEFSDLMLAVAAPYVQRYLNTSELLTLWESGSSPGLTEFQRAQYLKRLETTHRS